MLGVSHSGWQICMNTIIFTFTWPMLALSGMVSRRHNPRIVNSCRKEKKNHTHQNIHVEKDKLSIWLFFQALTCCSFQPSCRKSSSGIKWASTQSQYGPIIRLREISRSQRPHPPADALAAGGSAHPQTWAVTDSKLVSELLNASLYSPHTC